MLVVASDIHLSDETVGVAVSEKTFSLFASRLRELAYQASWRMGGRYEPVRQVDIVLLGDILDPLQSTAWLDKYPGQEGYVRPWHNPQSELFTQKVSEITRAILQKNQHALGVLRKISEGEAIYLPPADRNGKPDPYTRERVKPKVNIYYMVGNHDWFYHLPGLAYDVIRAEIIHALGLSNSTQPFPYGPETAVDDLAEAFSRYRLVARHGDCYDPMSYNRILGRKAASLSDIYSSEVLYRFPFEVSRQLGDELPPNLVRGIQRMINVRPLTATPLWLFDQIHRHGSDSTQMAKVKKIWDAVIEDYLGLDILRSGQLTSPRTLNTLKIAFGLSKKTSIPAAAIVSRIVRNHSKEEHISIARFAAREPDIRSGQADFVIYGHTHSHEVVPIDKRAQIDSQTGRVYINTGSWTTIFDYYHQPKIEQKTRHTHLLTCVALYQEGERQGRRYENWWANFV
jgi:UDP-2,3-diacylglucosamine pyrophosphatase LpxH